MSILFLSLKQLNNLKDTLRHARPFTPSVADDFGYVCLDKGKRKLVNVVDTSQAQRRDKSRATS